MLPWWMPQNLTVDSLEKALPSWRQLSQVVNTRNSSHLKGPLSEVEKHVKEVAMQSIYIQYFKYVILLRVPYNNN